MKTLIIGAAVGTAAGMAAALCLPCFRPTVKRMLYKKKRQMLSCMRKMCI